MPTSKIKTYILDDLPTDVDRLDFQPYASTLAEICQTASTPLTIGVFGTWGQGKTSLMRMVRKKLPTNYTIAWFDAWKYDKEEILWRAFMLSVLLAVQEKSGETEELQKLKQMLYRNLELEKAGGVTINLPKLGAKVAQGVVQIGLAFIPPLAQLGKLAEELVELGAKNISDESSDAIRREFTQIHIDQVRSWEQFHEKFQVLIESYIAPSGRLVVFVDDLDRCLPEKAIEVLEAIKLFLDATGCVFILGLAQDVIARGVEIRYKEFWQDFADGKSNPIDGTRYLEKIIQLPFTIPQVERGGMEKYVKSLTRRWPDPECPHVFAEGLGNNPRQIKRTVNVFMMLWQLAGERRLRSVILPVRLAKVVTIQSVNQKLYEELSKQPGLLRDIEAYFLQARGQKGSGSLGEQNTEKKEVEIDLAGRVQLPDYLLRLVTTEAGVGNILTMHAGGPEAANFNTLKPDEIRLYFTLARPSIIRSDISTSLPSSVYEPQLVKIPVGNFLMGTTPTQANKAIKEGMDKNWIKTEQPQHTVQLKEYWIGKYPVTNREYQGFVIENGHPAPQGWNGSEFPENKGDHPVVNISWEDADTFCKWLVKKTDKNYHLPTEAEWEKAARGTQGLVYPWGNEFDPGKANTIESAIRDTSPVGQFSPQGDSPYGCADMAGNVWEWCQDWYDENAYKGRENGGTIDPGSPATGSGRVVRGGSWHADRVRPLRRPAQARPGPLRPQSRLSGRARPLITWISGFWFLVSVYCH